MQDIPPPPPPAQEWPQHEAETTLRQEFAALAGEFRQQREEFREFRQDISGSTIYPGGQIGRIEAKVDAAEVARKEDVTMLHRRLSGIGDEVVAKINGTYDARYVKADDLPFAVEAALGARRSRRWGKVGRFFGNETVKLLGGVAIAVIAALILGHVTGHL